MLDNLADIWRSTRVTCDQQCWPTYDLQKCKTNICFLGAVFHRRICWVLINIADKADQITTHSAHCNKNTFLSCFQQITATDWEKSFALFQPNHLTETESQCNLSNSFFYWRILDDDLLLISSEWAVAKMLNISILCNKHCKIASAV